jgi:ABC-type nitrate/sulfonate/bicarbonate transport system permease component
VTPIVTNAGGGALTGGGPVAAAAGVATFSTTSIDKVGTGYTLTASSGTLGGATSWAFNIFANTATHLVFFVQPVNTVAGVAIAPAVVVHALDGSNNIATGFSGGITVSIANNASGVRCPARDGAAVGGIATFNT